MFFIAPDLRISEFIFGVKGLGSPEEFDRFNQSDFDRSYSRNRDSYQELYMQYLHIHELCRLKGEANISFMATELIHCYNYGSAISFRSIFNPSISFHQMIGYHSFQ